MYFMNISEDNMRNWYRWRDVGFIWLRSTESIDDFTIRVKTTEQISDSVISEFSSTFGFILNDQNS